MPIILSPPAVDLAYSWLDADGGVHSLSGNPNYNVLVGEAGLMLPPIDFKDDLLPLDRGSRLNFVISKPRIFDLPLLIEGSTAADLDAKIRDLAYWLDPVRGMGKIQHTAIDDVTRELRCRYLGGLEGDKQFKVAGPTHQACVLTFKAFDPLWYDATDHTESHTTPQTVTLTNIGDVDAWPIWEIHAPAASGATIENLTTGKKIVLNLALTGAQIATIDTTPLVKTATRENGSNLYSYLSSDTFLFPLVKGANSVSLTLGAPVDVTWRNRWLTP